MKERLQGLKDFAEQYYWNHIERIHFIAVMAPGFYQQMAFPQKFVENSKEKLSGNVILKGPSGNLWVVKLLKVQGDLLFKDGWKEFVEAHNVEEGDMLSFEYEGYSCFNVLIYDTKSRCERECSYFARNHKNIIADTCLPKKESVEEPEENMHESSPPDNHERHSPRVHCDDSPQVEKLSPLNFTSSNARTASKSVGAECDDQRSKVRKSERLVHQMGSAENMHKHESHLPTVPCDDDRQPQKFSPRTSKRKSCSNSPTVASADRGRKIRKGELKVSPHFIPQASPSSHDASTSKSKRGRRPRKVVQENTEQKVMQLRTCRKTIREVHLVSNRRPVTDEEKDGALLRASQTKPDNPFFRIVMRSTHVYRRHFMTIPIDFVTEHIHPGCQTAHLRLANGKGTWRDVRLIQQSTSYGFSGQLWRNFVQDNNLEEGDVCIFELCGADKILSFDVHIFRVVEEVTPLDKQAVLGRKVNTS
ncbi:B3 domain-containing protein-like isoform X1 [Iris pallida]|uniref:B3 domain-containing protein-like isoform X1 n=1 Tax=Iris pallida TaxID=29817 RepID=A0AAX6EKH9_IRIPA|nr:B3 domain-containing protein-like isoform X1 [Iris pallida]